MANIRLTTANVDKLAKGSPVYSLDGRKVAIANTIGELFTFTLNDPFKTDSATNQKTIGKVDGGKVYLFVDGKESII